MQDPPVKASVVTESGIVSPVWRKWFQLVTSFIGSQPFPMAQYTVSTAPAASAFTGCVIYVSNETGGATLAFSDGTNWRRVQDRNIIS